MRAEDDAVVDCPFRPIDELVTHMYRPIRARKKEIPKDGGRVRVLSIPSIRDDVVQWAMKLMLEPIFEADFQSGRMALAFHRLSGVAGYTVSLSTDFATEGRRRGPQ